MDDDLRQSIDQRMAILARLESILIDDLEIPFEPGTIDPDAPLFGTGLALDSMDAIELVIRAERMGRRKVEIPLNLVEKREPSIKLSKRVPKVLQNIAQLVYVIRIKGE